MYAAANMQIHIDAGVRRQTADIDSDQLFLSRFNCLVVNDHFRDCVKNNIKGGAK